MKTIVLAVGGNALLRPGDKGTDEEQMQRAHETAENIYDLFINNKVVITHGNGPQVGAILLQNEHSRKVVPPMPLDICGAMSQGEIGYMLAQGFHDVFEEKGLHKEVVTVMTRVIVDENDPAFLNPTKPVGPFYSKNEANKLAKEKGWIIVEDSGRGWRRVVPSPMPLKIVEQYAIRNIIDAGFVGIAVGGGGVPVIKKNGRLVGVEGVIDKDLASSVLARDINANMFIILTSVEKVFLNFGTPEQKALDEITVSEARRYMKEGHFKKGSMYPKILASVIYLENGGKEVLITSPEKLRNALEGKTGTRIIN